MWLRDAAGLLFKPAQPVGASQGELYKLEKTKFFEIAAHHLTFLGMQSFCWLSTGPVQRCKKQFRCRNGAGQGGAGGGGGGGAGQPKNSHLDQEAAQDEASAVWPDCYQCHLLSMADGTRMESFVCKSRSSSIQVEEASDRVTTPHASAGAAAAISAG